MKEKIDEVFSGYHGEESELIPILQQLQEVLGYLPREALEATARFLNIPESSVYGVATFYAQFHLSRQGRHRVKVCQGTACHVRGSASVMKAVTKKIGIAPGETTGDYEFSLERVACFGSCALAPVMVVDGQVHGSVNVAKAESMLDALRASPVSSRPAGESGTAGTEAPALQT